MKTVSNVADSSEVRLNVGQSEAILIGGESIEAPARQAATDTMKLLDGQIKSD